MILWCIKHTTAHLLDKSCHCNHLSLFLFSHKLVNIASLWHVLVVSSRHVTNMNLYVQRFSHRISFVSPCEARHLLQWGFCVYLIRLKPEPIMHLGCCLSKSMQHTRVGQQLATQQEAYNVTAVACLCSCSACMNTTATIWYTLAKLLWSIKASDPGELTGVRLVDEFALSRPKGLS